jgi:quinol monooxygenase YgiN
MYMRLTFCKFSPSSVQEAKKAYMEEVIPVLLQQKGIIDAHLLEPTEHSDDYISMTQWNSKEDADAYVFSRTFHKLVTKLEGFLANQPVTKTYHTEKVMVPF